MNLTVEILKATTRLLRLVFFAALVLTVISLSLFTFTITSGHKTPRAGLISDLDNNGVHDPHSNATSDLNASDANARTYNLSYFQKKRQDDRFYELMEVFDRAMTENGLTYFLYGGTLLGSYRHHGFVPWDDDLDVIVPDSLRNLTGEVLAKISPSDYVLYFDYACYWKLFSPHWDSIEGRPWRFPFLDIFFYEDNDTHIWDACPDYKNYFTYAKSVVFPLRRRPFLNLSLLAPRDARSVVAQTNRIDICQSNYFCHSLEKFVRYTRIPCSWLDSLHPFVRRTYMNGGCNETLVDRGNITKVFFDRGVIC